MVNQLPSFLRRWIRRLRDLPQRFREWPAQRTALGSVAARKLSWSAFAYPIGDPRDQAGPVASIMLPGLLHPFYFRQGTSDVLVIKQLFVQHEYRRLQGLSGIQTMLDVGANIGAASVMLLTLFPQARLIAVEPEVSNVEMLRRNLEPYGSRAIVVEAGVWPTSEPLTVVKHLYRDGLDWSNQVKPSGADRQHAVAGLAMKQIMEQSHIQQIDLLKMDIEGAERQVLLGNTDWLAHVKHLCIELHGIECEQALEQALLPYHYNKVLDGETVYCHDIHRAT